MGTSRAGVEVWLDGLLGFKGAVLASDEVGLSLQPEMSARIW